MNMEKAPENSEHEEGLSVGVNPVNEPSPFFNADAFVRNLGLDKGYEWFDQLPTSEVKKIPAPKSNSDEGDKDKVEVIHSLF